NQVSATECSGQQSDLLPREKPDRAPLLNSEALPPGRDTDNAIIFQSYSNGRSSPYAYRSRSSVGCAPDRLCKPPLSKDLGEECRLRRVVFYRHGLGFHILRRVRWIFSRP